MNDFYLIKNAPVQTNRLNSYFRIFEGLNTDKEITLRTVQTLIPFYLYSWVLKHYTWFATDFSENALDKMFDCNMC